MALRAVAVRGWFSNRGGCRAGIPPSVQLPSMPLPSDRDTPIWRSGSVFPSSGKDAFVSTPTAIPLGPGAASTTRKKPAPPLRWKRTMPSGLLLLNGGIIVPSAPARPTNVNSGPTRGTDSIVRTAPRSAALNTESPLGSEFGHPGPAPSNSALAAITISAESTRPSQFKSAGSAQVAVEATICTTTTHRTNSAKRWCRMLVPAHAEDKVVAICRPA